MHRSHPIAVDNPRVTPYRRPPTPCPDGGIGRRTSFRCWRSQGRGGSSPLLGTSTSQVLEISGGSSKKRSPESICYPKLLPENGPLSGRKSRETVSAEGRVLERFPHELNRWGSPCPC
ncbi:hypothetical protein NOVOSPHI9U_20200 [Novosphingobium sp. 9U]|nr:hypothetical protein NOVOSPHI9U_20200 [Novosphingobium sp. 9U]